MRELAGKVAIVTGASRGIGRAISIALGGEGATVVLAARAVEKLEQTAEQVRRAGGEAEIVVTELAEEDSIKRLVKVTEKKFGRLDIVVNNAGVTHSAKLEETATEDWERCMLVNARAPFILCREALPLLRKAQKGCIINIASGMATKATAGRGAYCVAKAGVAIGTTAIWPFGSAITVNAPFRTMTGVPAAESASSTTLSAPNKAALRAAVAT